MERSPLWDVVHCSPTALEGWLVLVLCRHVTAVDLMTDAEASELGPLIKPVSAALRAALGCEKTYVAQFAEHPNHLHVHVHVIPRMPDLGAGHRSPHLRSPGRRVGVVTESRVDELAREIAAHL